MNLQDEIAGRCNGCRSATPFEVINGVLFHEGVGVKCPNSDRLQASIVRVNENRKPVFNAHAKSVFDELRIQRADRVAQRAREREG